MYTLRTIPNFDARPYDGFRLRVRSEGKWHIVDNVAYGAIFAPSVNRRPEIVLRTGEVLEVETLERMDCV
jgi:hypothetical protein